MALAYLFNQYPQTSQTALRREIAALEGLGQPVERFTMRRFRGELVDPLDRAERDRTRAVLDEGALGLLGALLRTALTRPAALARAAALAIRVGRPSERGVLIHLIYLAEACVLLRWFARRGIEHVHTHYGTNSAAAAMLCRALGGPPYSFTLHGPEEFDAPRALSLREKIHRAAFVVAISEFTRSQLYRWADAADWPKIHVVRCGVSAAFLEAGPTPVPSAPRLVNIGRIVEQKGQLLLIEAAARLAAEGRDFHIAIVGDGPMRPECERRIEQRGLRGRVEILGYQSNDAVRRELQAARALVLPSFAEGLPGVFFEALALGRPVITTYLAGHPELVEPGVCGWLVPAGSVEALADALRAALAADPAELGRMGRAGAERVARRHDARIEAARLAALFAAASPRSNTAPGISG